MKLRLILPASAAAIFLAASCTPYQEPPPPAPVDPAANKQTEEQKQKAAEQKEKRKKEAEELANKEKETEGATPGGDNAIGNGNSNPDATPPKDPEKKKTSYPTAKAVPGKDGQVFSPYNNKIVDVKDIPPGKLVADPTYPKSEKKYFRVPAP